MKNSILLFLLVLFASTNSFAQTGNTCDSAIAMPSGNPSCIDSVITSGGALWFKFVATSPRVQITIHNSADTTMGHIHQISVIDACPTGGTIGKDSAFVVSSSESFADSILIIDTTGFIVGNTYYIRTFYNPNATICRICTIQSVTFGICVENIFPIGSSCSNPIPLSFENCLENQQPSSIELWYRFQANSTSVHIAINDEFGSDSVLSDLQLFSEECPNSTLIASSIVDEGGRTLTVNSLNVTTYYLIKITKPSNIPVKYKICLMPIHIISPCILPGDFNDPSNSCELISNGSFEYNQTPIDYYSQLEHACPWQYLTGTTDLFNSSAPLAWSVPTNNRGSGQPAHTGNGYAGFILLSGGNSNYREYATQALTQPLIAGKSYTVSFWVLRANGVQYAVDQIGAAFTNSIPVQSSNYGPITSVTPQIVSPTGTVIGSTTSWTQITGTFIANGGELYITIGEFNDDQSLTITNTVPTYFTNNPNEAYYFLDDVSVRPTINLSITSNPVNPCANVPFSLSAITSGGNPSNYFWSGTSFVSPSNTQTVTTSPGTNPNPAIYFCTVTFSDYNNCTLSASTSLNINPAPVVSFSYSPFSVQCIGVPISYTASSFPSDGSTLYSWNFGDNTTAIGTNATHTYNSPGSYTVTLTVTNSCGTSSVTQVINVAPSTSTYNPNCCSDSLPFTYDQYIQPQSMLISNPISAPRYWTNQNYFIRGTIIIAPGAELVIDGNSIIEFDPFSKILVLPGGILIVNNATLKGLTTCGTMWQGIEVAGDKLHTQTQIQVPATGQLYQGKAILTNATIRDAHNGVALGRQNGNTYNPNAGGGILLATTSTFLNCGYGVRFTPYPFVDLSRIIDCNFSSTTLLDPGYNAFNNYTYPNTANPFYGYANPTQRTYAFGLTLGVKFVQFKGNTFTNAEYGIIGVNSALLVIPDANGIGNTFLQMNVGETHANIFTSPFYANRVEHNIYNGPTVPIMAWSGMVDKINSNDVRGAFVGIGMVSDRAFFVNDNLVGSPLGSCLVGISASNSGTMGGLIGFTVRGNNFTNCVNGAILGNNNSFLQVHCNEYHNDINAYNRNWNNSGPLADQGNFPILTDKDPAGNRFFPTFPTTDQIYSTSNAFIYYRHSDPIMTPIPFGPITVTNTGFAATSTSCIPGPPCSNCSGRLSQLDGAILQLESEKTIIENQLDGGQTQQLFDAINSNISSGQLESLLLSHSPLSDQVLLAYIAKNGTPPGIFKNVIVPNSPVSKDVRPALDSKIAGMAPGIKNQIISAQSNYSNRTLSVVDRELQNKIGERQQVYNQQMDYFVNESENNPLMKDSVYTLLSRQNTEAAKEAIAASYLADENYPSASIAIAALNPSTPEGTSEKDFLTLMYNIYSGGRDVFQMTSVEEQQVRSLAALADDCLARANARVILFVVFGEPLQMDINLNNSARISEPMNSSSSVETETFLGESYPNPATDEVTIECNVTEGTVAVLKVFDMNGRLLTSKQLANGQQLVTLDVHLWEAGVYMYQMVIDDKVISYQKMVITNK